MKAEGGSAIAQAGGRAQRGDHAVSFRMGKLEAGTRRGACNAQSPPPVAGAYAESAPVLAWERPRGAGTSPATPPGMTNLVPSLSILPLLLALAGLSCESDSTPPKPVADLPDTEAQALCQQFFVAACNAGLSAKGDPACTACDPCTQDASLATIRSECGDGITDASVRHCVSSQFDMPTCTGPERGGCMFDVGDTLCPSVSAP